MTIEFTIEVPFPTDCAPFKIIRTEHGKRRIVDAAQTREKAERLLRTHEDEEPDWYAISNGLELGQPL